MKKVFEAITTLIYMFAATALTIMALSIMAWSVYGVFVVDRPSAESIFAPL